LRVHTPCAIVLNGEGRGPKEAKSVQLASVLTSDHSHQRNTTMAMKKKKKAKKTEKKKEG